MRWVSLPAFEATVEIAEVQKILEDWGGPTWPGSLEEAVFKVLRSVQTKGKLAIFEIAMKRTRKIRLEDGTVLEGLGVGALLRRSQQVGAFVVTLGRGPDDLARASRERSFRALVDAVSSLALSTVTTMAQVFIDQLALSEQRAVTRALLPGECDWSKSQRQVLDALVGFESVGVHLLPEGVLVPSWTRSGIMGIGPTGSAGRNIEARPVCAVCPFRDDCPGPG
ncbi:MAG: hypothetical protein JXR96_05640 [Deltaproteobacteria bacterium]|nr:hypothetical protein [Deltaproteobacteria bacterium]